jgi:hypothetical protein
MGKTAPRRGCLVKTFFFFVYSVCSYARQVPVEKERIVIQERIVEVPVER